MIQSQRAAGRRDAPGSPDAREWALRAPLTPWLPLVTAVNLGYCVLVAAELFWHRGSLTTLGLVYSTLEIFVIVAIVLEARALRAESRDTQVGAEAKPPV